jgi:hypothetical protein
MPEDLLILLTRILGIAGMMLLAASAVLGSLLASRTAQKLFLQELRGLGGEHPLEAHVTSAIAKQSMEAQF